MDCYAGQFAKYEGLTVNAAEVINTAGGEIVGDDGKTPTVDTPRVGEGTAAAGRRLQERRHPEGRRSPSRRRRAARRSRPASCCSCATGRTCTAWPDRRQLVQGEGQVRGRPAARQRPAPGASIARWPQRGASARTPSTRRRRWTSSSSSSSEETSRSLRRRRARCAPVARRAVRATRRSIAQVPVPADAEGVDRERGPASGHAVLPGRDEGDRRTTPTPRSRARRRCEQAIKDMQAGHRRLPRRLI